MNNLIAALWTEGLKIRRSKMLWLTVLAFSIAPLMGGFFMFVLKDPEFARESGLIGSKAQIFGEGDWPTYFRLLAQAVSVGGVLVFGFVFSWVFGREYTDRTIKDLLALPVSRATIVLSKFIVVFLWCSLLSLIVMVVGLIIGSMINLPGWSAEIFIHGLYVIVISAILTIFLSVPVSFFASFGRGYLPPMGFVAFTLVLAQIIAATGYGVYFPWSIPALYSGVAGEESSQVGMISYLILIITSASGMIATFTWWRFADQS